MIWLLYALLVLIFVFSSVIFFGAPFLPTLKAQTDEALDLLNLKPGQTLLELGSGDGRILRAAAERGIKTIGYELNPLLYIYSMARSLRHRKLITVHWGNYWAKPLPQADGMYVFLLNRYMSKLDTKIMNETTKPLKVVSFAFAFPGRTPFKQSKGLMLYSFSPHKPVK
jgi:16S rRNA A1518/A1519 N6-dimethyltransferase RsmA/KsgA/DIM1 with predicted DNA glycosylase/AP lyase activity